MLDVGDGNLVYWEARGNPDGKPALVVHGGPGSGCERADRPLLRPRSLPDRALRPARLRAEHAARERPGHRHEREHHRAPARRHGAAARAPRHRAVAAVRRLVGIDADPRLRRAAPGARVGDRHRRRDHDAGGRRSTGSTGASAASFRRSGSDFAPASRRPTATATCSRRTRG